MVSGGARYRQTGFGMLRFQSAPQASDYLNALTDPFFAAPPKLGVFSFTPTGKLTVYKELPTIGQLTSTAFAIVFTQTPIQTIRVYKAAASNTLLSAATITAFDAANAASVEDRAQLGRVINGALRVKCRYQANGLPGIMGGLYFPSETLDTIETLTFEGLVNLNNFRPFNGMSASYIGGEVQYRPGDVTDFEFAPISVDGGAGTAYETAFIPRMVVVGMGWPATATWEVESTVLYHAETLAGADSAGDQDGEPDLVDGGETIDSLTSAVKQAGEPVVTSLENVNILDEALSNIDRVRPIARGLPRGLRGALGPITAGLTMAAASATGLLGSHHPSNDGSAPNPGVPNESSLRGRFVRL